MSKRCSCETNLSAMGIKGLRHDGTSRNRRWLKALSPEYVKIDERRLEDLLCFLEKYATLIAYYNSQNKPDGNWQDFITTDISTLLAKIVKTNYRLVGETFRRYLDILKDSLSAEDYKPLFDIIFSLFYEFEKFSGLPIYDIPFKEELEREITIRLRGELATLIKYYNKGVEEELIDDTIEVDSSGDGYRFSSTKSILEKGFSSLWIDPAIDEAAKSWQDYYTGLATNLEDVDIYGDSEWQDKKRIEYSLSFLKALFSRVYGVYIRLITGAGKHLVYSLENYPRHKAHNALLLAFLKLFSYAQEELNSLTERHLEFYYKEVLRLKEKPENPDSVHIVVELAKHVDEYILKAGTELKAGKDATGKELIYSVDKDITLNRARVESLKTLFVEETKDAGKEGFSIYVSSDPLKEDADTMWRPFGEPQSELAEKTMELATAGFAITSPVLRLAGGKRIITITITPEEEVSSDTLKAEHFRVELSGKKGWIEVSPDEKDATEEKDATFKLLIDDAIKFEITLPEAAEPVVDYDPEKLDGGYDTNFPVVRFLLNEQVPLSAREITINKEVEIKVKVEGLRELILQSDQGVLDPSSPFMPFGAQPIVGSSFYVGSREIFSKQLKELTLSIEWMGLPEESFVNYYSYGEDTNKKKYLNITSDNDFKVKPYCLKDGSWSTDCINGSNEAPLFKYNSNLKKPEDLNTITFKFTDSHKEYPELEEFNSYGMGLKQGFLRLELSNPADAFGHALYPQVYTDWIVKDGGAGEQPRRPYTPTIKSLSCNYIATASVDGESHRFLHIHPFGYRYQEILKINEDEIKAFSLLPPVLKTDKNGYMQAALHVGIGEVEPSQTVSILFQVAEGTEDSSVDVPDVIEWHYLSTDGSWKALEDYIIEDTTNSLLTSGIIRLSIPEDASLEHTLMPQGMRWIRVSISDRYRAFPLMVDVVAQAGVATFKNMGNDPFHLASPLPSGSITKPVRSDSSIKKITQPYPSFGGRMREAPQEFYRRVSERLRHKNRAITVWDYERLVLEEFPFIYKVKCLPHTEEANELSPGAVKVVVVPDITKQQGIDPFKPMVSNNNRKRIKELLEALSSGFVKVSVENPVYEAVRVDCKVAFGKGFDENYYKKQLEEDLKRFLAPWAFEDGRELTFGGSLHRSMVVGFMENLHYVDHVMDVTLSVVDEEGNAQAGRGGLSEIVLSKPWAVLTTHWEHRVEPGACSKAG